MEIMKFLGDLPGLGPIPKKDWSSASAVTTFFQVGIAAAGLVAVAFIVINAIQMATSNGDPGKVKKAREGILYSVIGLIIVIMAEAIIFFVSSNVE
ncbi:hypothetical protein IJI91_00595 [Candidatus Saccharibacteria bacterium]|nr:hypothetical protein [Candidatus Saccharibacteria bacterium]